MKQTTKNYKRWSEEEDNLLKDEIVKNKVHNVAFMAVATQTGRSISAITQHYEKLKGNTATSHADISVETVTVRTAKKWTEDEEQRLIRQVRAFPQNLNRCFLIISEEIERTPAAIASHWYSVTSKRPDVICFFTASAKHVAKNRKNGEGVPSTTSIWKKFLKILKRI